MSALWKHQQRGLDMGLELNGLGIFFEIGTGKSRTAIEILRHRCAHEDRLLRTLILAPKIVLTNWQREIQKFSKVHPRDVVVLAGSAKKRVKDLIDNCNDQGVLNKGRILITNYEALQMEELLKILMDWRPEMVIADEAHRLKNPESKRARASIRLGDQARFRYALTGTPVLNSAMDLFNIFRFIDKGETFGTNFWRFRSVWFEDTNADWSGKQGYFPKYEPRPESYSEMNKLIYKKAISAKKSDCLDLPPFVRQEVFVELGSEQRKVYKDMKDEYIAYVKMLEASGEQKAVVAQLAITKALRLQQIVTGYAKTEDGSIHKMKENPRLSALQELLEDLAPEHKVIVWSVFHENYADIARLCEKLKIDYTELHGKVAQKDRDANIKRFNDDPVCRVLIANQAAGGIGINLVSSDVSIFYSKNFSLEQDLQAEGRNYRGGSEIHQSVTRIDIIAEGTIDELVTAALKDKQNISNLILDWKKDL